MTPTIYVVGNIKSFFSALTALQMLFNPANNTLWASGDGAFGGGPLIALGLVITLVILFIATILKQRFEMHQILILVIIYGLLFGVKTEVNVENMYNGDSSVVQGIPVGIAYPASIFSTVAFEVSKEIGEAFQQASNMDTSLFTGTNGKGGVYGFDGPLAMTYKMRGIYSLFSLQDAPLSNSVSSFVASCIEPTNDVAEGQIGKSGSLTCSFFGLNCGSGEAPLTLANAQATLYVNSEDDTTNPQLVNCSTAATTLGDAWTTFQANSANSAEPSLASLLSEKSIGASHDNETPADASQLIGAMLQGTVNTGYNYMNNMILNCSFQAGEHEGLSVYDPNMPYSMDSYCVTKASAFGRQVAMNAGTASLFGMNMLPLMAILQFLFFAMAPIVLGVAMMQGMAGLSSLAKYLLFGAWTESWMPVAALINDYSQQMIGETFTKLRDNMSSSLHITSPAYLGAILDHAERDLSMANFMMGMTPVLTFAILSGSYFAFTQIGSAARGDNVVDKNMSESTPTLGNSTMAGSAQQKVMVSSGGTAGAFRSSLAGDTQSFNMGQTAGSVVTAAKHAAVQAQTQAAMTSQEQAADTNTILDSANSATSSFLKNNSTGQLQFSEAKKHQQEIASAFKVSKTQAVEAAAALNVAAGGNLLGMVGKWTDKSVGDALDKAELGGKFTAQQVGSIKDAMNQENTAKRANSLTSATTAALLSQVASGTESTASKGVAANLAKSATRTKALTAQAAALESQSQQMQAAASEAINAGGAQAFNQNSLAAAMESEMQKVGGPASASPYTFGKYVADNHGLGGLFEKGFQAAPRSDSLQAKSAYAMMYAANRTPDKAAALAAIAEAAGNSPFTHLAAQMQAAQQSIKNIGARTNFGDNDAAVAGAAGTMAAVEAQTGTPSVGATAAEVGQNNAAATGFYNGTSGTQAANFAAPEAYYQSAKAAAEKIQAMPGFNKFRQTVNDAVKNNAMSEAAQFIHDNPALASILGAAAAGAPVAGSALLGGKAYSKFKGAKAAEAAKNAPHETTPDEWNNYAQNQPPRETTEADWNAHAQGSPADGAEAAGSGAAEDGAYIADLAKGLGVSAVGLQALLYSGGIGKGGTLYSGQELTDKLGNPPGEPPQN